MLVWYYDLSFKVNFMFVCPFLGSLSCSWTDAYGVCLGCEVRMYHVRIYYRYLLVFYLLSPSC